MRIYWAAPLFAAAERVFNAACAEVDRGSDEDGKVYL
jgi:hypothetical protein